MHYNKYLLQNNILWEIRLNSWKLSNDRLILQWNWRPNIPLQTKAYGELVLYFLQLVRVYMHLIRFKYGSSGMYNDGNTYFVMLLVCMRLLEHCRIIEVHRFLFLIQEYIYMEIYITNQRNIWEWNIWQHSSDHLNLKYLSNWFCTVWDRPLLASLK